jgi:hypothetical protein
MAASEEAVTDHARDKHEDDESQDDCKQEASNPERGRLWSFRAGCIRFRCHKRCLYVSSVLAVGPPIIMNLQFPYCHPHSIVSYTRRSVGSFRFYDRSVAGSEPEFTSKLQWKSSKASG